MILHYSSKICWWPTLCASPGCFWSGHWSCCCFVSSLLMSVNTSTSSKQRILCSNLHTLRYISGGLRTFVLHVWGFQSSNFFFLSKLMVIFTFPALHSSGFFQHINCRLCPSPLIFQPPPLFLTTLSFLLSIKIPPKLYSYTPLLCTPSPVSLPAQPSLWIIFNELLYSGRQISAPTHHWAQGWGTRSAFRSALSLHFAINPFHTEPHHCCRHHPPLHHTPILHLNSLYFSTHVMPSPLYLHLSAWFFFLLAIFYKVFLFSDCTFHTSTCSCFLYSELILVVE